jgi:hypothetical protein
MFHVGGVTPNWLSAYESVAKNCPLPVPNPRIWGLPMGLESTTGCEVASSSSSRANRWEAADTVPSMFTMRQCLTDKFGSEAALELGQAVRTQSTCGSSAAGFGTTRYYPQGCGMSAAPLPRNNIALGQKHQAGNIFALLLSSFRVIPSWPLPLFFSNVVAATAARRRRDTPRPRSVCLVTPSFTPGDGISPDRPIHAVENYSTQQHLQI